MKVPPLFTPTHNLSTNMHPLYFWGYALLLGVLLFELSQ
jgi:hypothetical protein